jgi:putative endonuclease
MGKREVGIAGEKIACQFLVKRGFKILERNFRRRWGELDIIAEKDGMVRIVEVKAISRENIHELSREMDHQPEDMVDRRKLTKVARTAALYMESTSRYQGIPNRHRGGHFKPQEEACTVSPD